MEKINSKSSVEEFVRAYVQRGFGSMNKNDFEAWIFYQWRKIDSHENLSIAEMSRKLRIKPSKVKALIAEADVKFYNGDKNDYIHDFERALKNVEINDRPNGKCFSIHVENPAVQNYIKSVLDKENKFSDTSFSKDIMCLNSIDLECLQKHFYEKEILNVNQCEELKDIPMFKLLDVFIKILKIPEYVVKFKEFLGMDQNSDMFDLTKNGIQHIIEFVAENISELVSNGVFLNN